MHLTAGDIERIDDGDVAVDLEQSPGEIVVLSSADSELALLGGMAARRPGDAPRLRLANLMKLAHPASVDLYVEKTLRHARLVVVRAMGGVGYWPYGLDRLRELARGGGPRLVAIPGEDRWDDGLSAYSTVAEDDARCLWRCLVGGGAGNAAIALDLMAHLIGRGERPPEAETVASAGCYWPGEGVSSIEEVGRRLDPSLPVAPIVFYRSILQGGLTGPVDALVDALRAEGVAGLPVFVTSLKDRDSAAFLEKLFAALPPAIVLNATAFAVSRFGAAGATAVLDRPGSPVLQVIFAGSSEEAWRDSARGLLPRDLTMNVVLPEVDGRLITRTVSFKAETHDPLTDSRATTYRPITDRIAFVAELAARWVRLSAKPPAERRVALVLSNYPNRDGRIGNGVGLDTPESTVRIAATMREAGYDLSGFPETGADLMALLLSGQSNRLEIAPGGAAVTLGLDDHCAFLATLPEDVRDALHERWGEPEGDPMFADGVFHLAIHRFGNVVVGIQPSRGYNIDPKATYHDPDLVPPHHYLAFYAWLRGGFAADALVHVGKHGNLEWLPGKALGLSRGCWPEVALGAMPLIYPFIVNDPGEGAQAKRRSSAVIVDHLMPAMTRAEIHGPLAELETLIDEFYLAAGVDPRRRDWLENEILTTAERHGLDRDLGFARDAGGGALRALDAHLCELKELQIRDGLHILGASPEGRQRVDTLVAIARVPRTGERLADASLHRAIASDLGLDGFDPLDCDLGSQWRGPRPAVLDGLVDTPWRTAGDTVERIEMLAALIVEDTLPSYDAPTSDLPLGGRSKVARRAPGGGSGLQVGEPNGRPGVAGASFEARATPEHLRMASKEGGGGGHIVASNHLPGHPEVLREAEPLPRHPEVPREAEPLPRHPEVLREAEPRRTQITLPSAPRTRAVLDWIASDLAPSLDGSGQSEMAGVRAGLAGRFVPPGPSGAPSRGRPDVIPTGRNFYSVDVRAVPTAAAWALGKAAADALALRYFHDHGEWPRSIALSAWSTSNMRTGGDDIAQVLALLGAEPQWEQGTGRVTGFRVMALSELGRPRIDVTLKISGMFRDAFPDQIDLIDSAVRAVAALDEDAAANPIAAAVRDAEAKSVSSGVDPGLAKRLAATRIFGAKPGAYGAGMQALIDEGTWHERADFASAFLAWGSFAYGGGSNGAAVGEHFAERLKAADAILHNQDNREHDLLDSDDYYQFQGGMAATVETLKGTAPPVYHGDHSRPEKPVVRSLSEEIARVVRGRAANPKWIAGVMRHGYKGAFEMAATVDYLFAYAAMTNAVGDHHFDQLFDAYVADDAVRGFIAEANAPALSEMAARFREAIDRGLWSPRSNSAYDRLSALIQQRQEAAE